MHALRRAQRVGTHWCLSASQRCRTFMRLTGISEHRSRGISNSQRRGRCCARSISAGHVAKTGALLLSRGQTSVTWGCKKYGGVRQGLIGVACMCKTWCVSWRHRRGLNTWYFWADNAMAVKRRGVSVVCNERSMSCYYKIYICKWSLGHHWLAVNMRGSMFSLVSGGARDPSERIMLLHAL